MLLTSEDAATINKAFETVLDAAQKDGSGWGAEAKMVGPLVRNIATLPIILNGSIL